MNIISVKNIKKRFNLEAGFFSRFGRFVYAVNGVSFTIGENETYGLVGESGCGKTTTARLLIRMYAADEGSITFREHEDLRTLSRQGLAAYREKVKYVFQDPARSLNPRMTVEEVLLSGYRGKSSWPTGGMKAAREEAAAILEEVGLAAADLERRPAEFSGGQRQRISIARGLLLRPDLLICDEVVSALDVSIQGQILNLLQDLRSHRKLSFLFIAHNLKVACYFCDRIGVMYKGVIMEEAGAADLYKTALHPYTKLLFAAVGAAPDCGAAKKSTAPTGSSGSYPPAGFGPRKKLPGPRAFVKSAHYSSAIRFCGCAFADRCPDADGRCFTEEPLLQELQDSPPEGSLVREGQKPHLIRCFKA
ncbi:ATP-binding cassette domain-containing protein [Breznakiellaceae bacterium SP9]